MTSTQVDETAQHFYRKLGYRDAGGLLLDVPGYEQPMELFLIKAIDGVAFGGRVHRTHKPRPAARKIASPVVVCFFERRDHSSSALSMGAGIRSVYAA